MSEPLPRLIEAGGVVVPPVEPPVALPVEPLDGTPSQIWTLFTQMSIALPPLHAEGKHVA